MSIFKTYQLLACLFVLTHLTFVSNVSAESSNRLETIQTYREDVTGDGMKERIQLNGTLLSGSTNYYQDLEMLISSKSGKKWQVRLGGGYHPHLKFIDLDHDGISNVFFMSTDSSLKNKYPYKAFSFQNEQKRTLPEPPQPFVKGDFVDNFQINLLTDPSEKPITINLDKQAQQYINSGLYNRTGKLIKPAAMVTTDNINKVEPVFLGKQQGFALKSYLPVEGIAKNDHLGTIETLWYFKNGQWQNMHSEWISN